MRGGWYLKDLLIQVIVITCIAECRYAVKQWLDNDSAAANILSHTLSLRGEEDKMRRVAGVSLAAVLMVGSILGCATEGGGMRQSLRSDVPREDIVELNFLVHLERDYVRTMSGFGSGAVAMSSSL